MKIVLIREDGKEVVIEDVKGTIGDPKKRVIELENGDVITLKNLTNEIGFTNEETNENFTKITMINEEEL